MLTEAPALGPVSLPDPQAPTLLRSLDIQARVVRALLMRELVTRYGRRNLGMLWLIAEPAMFTLGVAAFWSFVGSNRSGLPIIAFAVTGYASVLMWRNTVGQCTNAIKNNLNLLYHRNVRVQDVFAARILLEMAGATAAFVILSVVLIGAEYMKPPADALKVVAGWLMLAWFGAALAITVGAVSSFSELVPRLWQPVSYLLFPLSGAAFMVTALPPGAQEFVLLFPMVHGLEMVREGWFGDAVRTRHDMGYMASFSGVLTLTGLLLLRVASRHAGAK